jgi:hypothetical protein
MKWLALPAWFAVPCLVFFGVGCGSNRSGSTGPGTSAGPKLNEMTAKVRSVDRGKMQILVVTDGKEQEVPFTKQTKFFSGDGFDISDLGGLSRALQGANATIKTDTKDGQKVAVEVRALPQ